MSLSKFYRANSDFKPSVVLARNLHESSSDPVWGSIVKPVFPEPPAEPVPAFPEPEHEQQDAKPVPTSPPEQTREAEQSPDKPIADTPVPSPQEIPANPPINIDAIREESFQSGIIAGRKQAEEDFENSARTLLCVCNELDRLRETILQNSIGEMRELVLAISEKIIRHSVAEQSDTITATITEAIHLAVKSDEFQIQLNPDDLACIEGKKSEIIAQISGLDNIVLKPDATLERGGCKIESTSCTIDASMASQLKVIRNSIMASE